MLTDLRLWILTYRLWERNKLPLLFLLFFFMAFPRIRFIIIINMDRRKTPFFNLLLNDFCKPRMDDFLTIFFFGE
jgi:hypothetical protein